MIKYIIYILIVVSIFLDQLCSSNAMTRAQIKKAGKLMRNVCQPKHKVTNDQVNNISGGEFIEDKNVMCYIACVFTMAQTVKNGKINYESALKQIDLMFPEDIKEPAKKAFGQCKHIADEYAKDICKASFETAKCIFKANPDVFMFP